MINSYRTMKTLVYTTDTPDQQTANRPDNQAMVASVTVLSVIGSCIIILTFIRYKDIRTPSRHVIVCIAISDLVSSLSNCAALLIKPGMSRLGDPCVIQSLIGTTFILSSFLWNMFLAISLFVVIVFQNTKLAERIIFPWFHLTGWFVPLTINMIAVSLDKLGNSKDLGTAGWCWIYLNRKCVLCVLLELQWEIRTWIVPLRFR